MQCQKHGDLESPNTNKFVSSKKNPCLIYRCNTRAMVFHDVRRRFGVVAEKAMHTFCVMMQVQLTEFTQREILEPPATFQTVCRRSTTK